jgi:hypothetical protein
MMAVLHPVRTYTDALLQITVVHNFAVHERCDYASLRVRHESEHT